EGMRYWYVVLFCVSVSCEFDSPKAAVVSMRFDRRGTPLAACVMKHYYSTIMVVDDDPNDLIFIEKAFRAIGVKDPIHTINGGWEAIAYIMGEGKFADRNTYAYPTFITTDLKMPGADGFAVLEHLRGNPEGAVIPTGVFSGSKDLDDIKKSYMLGASSYHVKPESLAALRRQMKVLHEYWLTC